jgi:hypothetical protein
MHKLAWLLAVAFHLSKVTGRDELLEDLHQILYARKGKVRSLQPSALLVNMLAAHELLSTWIVTTVFCLACSCPPGRRTSRLSLASHM